MDTSPLKKIFSKLSYEWFERKNYYFLKEGLYNSEQKKIIDSFEETDYFLIDGDTWREENRLITVDIDLTRYCWNSFFYGSISSSMDSENIPSDFPVDSSNVSDEVLEFINKKIKKFTDIAAIDAVITLVVQEMKAEVVVLQQNVPGEEYNRVLTDFVSNTRKKISSEFRHIKEQLRLNKTMVSVERRLNIEICKKIANFKIDNKKLITSVEGQFGEGEALFQLLNRTGKKKDGIKIRVEDWQNQAVFYLLSRLSEILEDNISPAHIQTKKYLYLRKGNLFTRGVYDSFKSAKLDNYIARKSNDVNAIEDQLKTLF